MKDLKYFVDQAHKVREQWWSASRGSIADVEAAQNRLIVAYDALFKYCAKDVYPDGLPDIPDHELLLSTVQKLNR